MLMASEIKETRKHTESMQSPRAFQTKSNNPEPQSTQRTKCNGVELNLQAEPLSASTGGEKRAVLLSRLLYKFVRALTKIQQRRKCEAKPPGRLCLLN